MSSSSRPAPIRTFHTLDELRAAVGTTWGPSRPLLIDQERVDRFADATGDHQWIHVDPVRAATGPFGATVAHGYLTLGLVPVIVASLVEYAGWGVRINYGSNKVRFPAPVLVGSELTGVVTLSAVDDMGARVQVTAEVTVTARPVSADTAPNAPSPPKPALVAEIVTMLADPAAG
jgi:acyl dehydratase